MDGLALGDTLLLERERDIVGLAVYHVPGVSEAPAGALYVKFLALDRPGAPARAPRAVRGRPGRASALELGLAADDPARLSPLLARL